MPIVDDASAVLDSEDEVVAEMIRVIVDRIMSEAAGRCGVKPLTPAQARARAARIATVQGQIGAEGRRHAEKVRTLRAKLSR